MPATCAGGLAPDVFASCLNSACAASQGAITAGWVALSASPSVQSFVCALPATADTQMDKTEPKLTPPNAWIVGNAFVGSGDVPKCGAYIASSSVNGALFQAPWTVDEVTSPALVLCTNGVEPFDFVAGPVTPACSMGVTLNVPGQPSTFIGTACRPPGGAGDGTPGELGTVPGTCVQASGSLITTYDEFCPPAGSFLATPP